MSTPLSVEKSVWGCTHKYVQHFSELYSSYWQRGDSLILNVPWFKTKYLFFSFSYNSYFFHTYRNIKKINKLLLTHLVVFMTNYVLFFEIIFPKTLRIVFKCRSKLGKTLKMGIIQKKINQYFPLEIGIFSKLIFGRITHFSSEFIYQYWLDH